MKRLIWLVAAAVLFAAAAFAADNLGVNSPTPGTAQIKTDDVGGVHYQGYKIYDGEPDSSAYADVTAGNALKVDGSAVTQPISGSVSLSGVVDTELPSAAALADAVANPTVTSAGVYIQFFNGTTWDRARGDTANGLDVDVTRLPALPAGTNNIGDVDVLTLPALPAGTNNIGDVDVLSLPALPAGTNNIGDVDVLTLPAVTGTVTANAGTGTFTVDTEFANQSDGAAAGTTGIQVLGTDGTNAQIIKTDTSGSVQIDCESGCGGGTQFAENAAHTTGDLGTQALAVRKDAGGPFGGDGDYTPLQTDANGALRVTGGGGGTEYTEDAAAATDPVGGQAMARRRDALSSETTADGDVTALNATAKGELYVKQSDPVAATQSGTWNINNLSGTVSLPTGASTLAEQQSQTTALQIIDDIRKNEDDASANLDPGAVLLARRTAAPANTSGADLDYEALQMAAGRLWTSSTIDAAIPAGNNNIGDIDVLTLPNVAQATAANLNAEVQGDAAGDAPVSGNPVLAGGRASAAAPTDVSADGDAVSAWHLRNGAAATVITAAGALVGGDAANGLDVDVTRLPALPAGTNNIGDVDVLTLPALPAGTNNIGDVDVLTLPALPAGTNNIGDVDVLTLPAIPAGTNNIGDVDVLTLPSVAQATASSLNAEVQGDAAHDATVSGNPVLAGGEARTSDGTAVANGDATRLQADLVGKLVVLPYAIPDNITQGCATSTGTGDTALEAAAGAGVRTYATSISVINTSATATYVTIKDGSTAIYEIPAPANNGGAVVPFPVPLRGTANTALNFASAAAVTTMRVCYNGYKSSN